MVCWVVGWGGNVDEGNVVLGGVAFFEHVDFSHAKGAFTVVEHLDLPGWFGCCWCGWNKGSGEDMGGNG